MRKIAFGIAAASLLIMPQLAFAQEGTAAGVATGAVTGAIVGGPVGAVVGAGVGGIAGGLAEQNAKMQNAPAVVVVPDAATTGSVRQRTCTVDASGNQACTDVVR
ncbi:glycine zipper domain-containing protein [Microvirga sesbaniae]|uniref:glycine zipper domain-containing protein n=1 Tax=Microvirga sesbaniae TaxID=681392 RepID=UPI0021C91A7F|nr:glycine zipper domain-containing protein [Microvirga sp. HBU67692]